MEEEEIGQEFDRVIRAGMMATSNVTDAIARRSTEQARVQREAAMTEARAADVAVKRAEQLTREAAHDSRAMELANIRATQATEGEMNRLTREALQVADRSIGRDEWWKNATPARIADTVSLAAETADRSPVAASVYERMGARINDLYGVDVDQVRAAAGPQEANRHSALTNAVDDALARRREEAEAANARTEVAEATKAADAAELMNKNSVYGQYADRDWLDRASADELAHAYGVTVGPAEHDQVAFVANGGIEDALHARFGVVEAIEKDGTPESIEAETSRLITAAAADRDNTDREYDGGEHQVHAQAAGIHAERHEDAAAEHGVSEAAEAANRAQAAAAGPQTAAARQVSQSFPDAAQDAIGKARRPGAPKARIDRGSSKQRGADHVLEP
jgi:hypothetical protein